MNISEGTLKRDVEEIVYRTWSKCLVKTLGENEQAR